MISSFVLLVIGFGSLIGAMGNLVIKKAVDGAEFRKLLFSPKLWVGLFLYGVSVLCYLLALSREELSVVYPLVSLTYVWTIILSVKYLGEKMNGWKYLSLIGIILGMVLIGMGS